MFAAVFLPVQSCLFSLLRFPLPRKFLFWFLFLFIIVFLPNFIGISIISVFLAFSYVAHPYCSHFVVYGRNREVFGEESTVYFADCFTRQGDDFHCLPVRKSPVNSARVLLWPPESADFQKNSQESLCQYCCVANWSASAMFTWASVMTLRSNFIRSLNKQIALDAVRFNDP